MSITKNNSFVLPGIRFKPEELQIIREAAGKDKRSVNMFVVVSALAAARQILNEENSESGS